MYNFSFIGAGNVVFRLSLALHEKGHTIEYIHSRHAEHADKVVKALNTNGSKACTAKGLEQTLSSDIVIVSVSDDAYPEVVNQISDALLSHGHDHLPFIFHTSGATDIDVLSPLFDLGAGCGVLYPMMTLSKNKNVDFADAPFLLESTSNESLRILESIAVSLNSEYYVCDSKKRLRMHTAAVFSCNFANYLLSLAFEVAGNAHTLLLPCTIEMVRKSFLNSPESALTGPAKRGDMKTIGKHLALLESLGMEEHKEIYTILTNNLIKRNKQ